MLYFHLFCLAVSKLDVFIDQAFTGDNGLVFSSGITLDSFRQLYSSPFESHLSRTGERLTSYIYENATILPRRSIAGTYICEGKNDNGTRNATITVDVKGTRILQCLILETVTKWQKTSTSSFICINAHSFNTTHYVQILFYISLQLQVVTFLLFISEPLHSSLG